MAKYILVYELNRYQELGGGTYAKDFLPTKEEEMHKFVEGLVKIHKDNLNIIYAGFLQTEYKYKTIEYAIKVEPYII